MSDLSVFVMTLAIAFILPGPDMILVMDMGARQGVRQAFVTSLGLAAARILHVTLSALGLAVILKTTPWAFEAVRLLGAAYLVRLGIQILRAPATGPEGPKGSGARAKSSYRAAFRLGFLTNLLNPAGILFCTVLLPQFIERGAPVGPQFLLLGSVLVTTGLVFDAGYALAGTRIGRCLSGRPGMQRAQNTVFSLLLIGFGIRLAAGGAIG